MCHRAVARLACSPTSARAARAFVTDQLLAWGVTDEDIAHDRVADVVLVTSELAGNAMKVCTGEEFQVSLVAHRDHIEVAVTDDDPHSARMQDPGPEAPSGRGLVLVDALAERWGQYQRGETKTVWARLAVPAGTALARDCTLSGG